MLTKARSPGKRKKEGNILENVPSAKVCFKIRNMIIT